MLLLSSLVILVDVCILVQRKAYNVQVAKSTRSVQSGRTLTIPIVYVGALRPCCGSHGRQIPIALPGMRARSYMVPTHLIYIRWFSTSVMIL
jgi:hypothetical protein